MDYVEELRSIFSRPDLFEAHQECVPVMDAMARDQEFFHGVILQCLSDPAYLDRIRKTTAGQHVIVGNVDEVAATVEGYRERGLNHAARESGLQLVGAVRDHRERQSSSPR